MPRNEMKSRPKWSLSALIVALTAVSVTIGGASANAMTEAADVIDLTDALESEGAIVLSESFAEGGTPVEIYNIVDEDAVFPIKPSLGETIVYEANGVMISVSQPTSGCYESFAANNPYRALGVITAQVVVSRGPGCSGNKYIAGKLRQYDPLWVQPNPVHSSERTMLAGVGTVTSVYPTHFCNGTGTRYWDAIGYWSGQSHSPSANSGVVTFNDCGL